VCFAPSLADMRSLSVCALISFAGLGAGNLLSPHLKKCLDIQLKEVEDDGVSKYEDKQGLLGRMSSLPTGKKQVNVQLYECHNEWNQRWRFEDGRIKSAFLTALGDALTDDYCLTVEVVAVDGTNNDATTNWYIDDGANVHIEKCLADNNARKETQIWTVDDRGSVRLKHQQTGVDGIAINYCLDAFAKESGDGGREVYSDMQDHETVNAQIYRCHEDTKKTWRKNQIWTWQPRQKGKFVTEQFLLNDLGFKASSTGIMMASAVSFLAVGVAIGVRRARRVTALTVPLEPTE